MNSERWEEVRRIAAEAKHQDADSRATFIRHAAHGDSALEADIWSVLREAETVADASPAASVSNTTLAPGFLLKNRYVIVRELSRGGFGVVYFAHDSQLHDKPVVVKVQLETLGDDPWFERKFADELRALALIDHPGVVGVLDSGKTGEGRPFLVMQYIDGRPLRSVIAPEGMPLERVADIIRQAGQALAAAHEKNVWHRDLKPENIMLQPLPGGIEHVRLIDFGIATVADMQAAQQRTSTRAAGSAGYMAPEQLGGQPSAAVDIYALGVIAYEMLTGRRPFIAHDAMQLAIAQRNGPKVKPSDLRPDLPRASEKIILQALAYNPKDRPPDARRFGEELAQTLLQGSSTSSPAPALSTAASRRRTLAITGAFAAAAALIAGGAWMVYSRSHTGTQGAAPSATSAAKPTPANLKTPDAAQTGTQLELAFWKSIEGENRPELYRAYLTRYPDGQFAAVARIKLAELSKQSAAPVRNDKPEKVAATLPPPADRDASRISATPEMPPGEVKVNRKDGQKYVWAPAGAFQMGCSPGDNGCTPAELPSHKVQITHGFWIGQTEVTVGAFKRYSQSTGRPMPREPIFGKQSVNPGWMKDDLPMVNISWHEAKSYCEWAGMRLPTEAEWEMAARAGNPGARYGFVKQIAWYGDNSGNKAINAREIFHDEQNDYRLRLIENGNSPRPVAQKTPNGYGLYDILGNAAEWVSDWFSESYYQSSPSQDPQGPPTGALRVHRGGAWNRMMRAVRVSARGGDEPDFRGPAVGCRCAGNLP